MMQNGSTRSAADIIIPVHNRFHLTRNLLEGIYRYSDLHFHIYVIDNASTDETVDLHKIYAKDITVVRNRENPGWCAGINRGLQLASNPYLVFMSNDVEVSQGWLGNLVAFLDTHPKIAAVGPLDSNPDHWQCVDRIREKMVPQLPHFLTCDVHERNRILRYHFHRAGILIEGTLGFFCAVLKRRAVDVTGGLDESAAGDHYEEEYCRRLRRSGYVLGLSLDTYVVNGASEARKPTAQTRRCAVITGSAP